MTHKPEEASIRRADGILPFNGYLWPTEDWWLGHEHPQYPSCFHFGYVALADGRFSTDGATYEIRDNRNCYGEKCVFPTREAAIRTSAARMIRMMRWSRHWQSTWDTLKGERLAFAINWALQIVARETNDVARKVSIQDLPPAAKPTGLPLFDFANSCLNDANP